MMTFIRQDMVTHDGIEIKKKTGDLIFFLISLMCQPYILDMAKDM